MVEDEVEVGEVEGNRKRNNMGRDCAPRWSFMVATRRSPIDQIAVLWRRQVTEERIIMKQNAETAIMLPSPYTRTFGLKILNEISNVNFQEELTIFSLNIRRSKMSSCLVALVFPNFGELVRLSPGRECPRSHTRLHRPLRKEYPHLLECRNSNVTKQMFTSSGV